MSHSLSFFIQVVIGIWLTSMATASPFFVTAYMYYDVTWRPICRSPIDRTWKQIYVITLLILFFFIPLTIIFLLYLLIGIRVRRESIRYRGSNNRHTSTGNSQHVLYLLVCIVVLFFVFLLPIRIIIIMKSLSPTSSGLNTLSFEGQQLVIGFARIMFYLNSACNPIVYSMVSRKFRNAFKCAFRGKMGHHHGYISAHGPSLDNDQIVWSPMTSRKSVTSKSTCTAQVKPVEPINYKITTL